MPRRQARGSRALTLSSKPTPAASAATTPLSSAHPSAYNTESEWDLDSEVNALPLGALTLESASPAQKVKEPKPFPFLSLPSELRIKIYGYHFAGTNKVIDLDSDNYKRVHQKLSFLRTCRQIYSEASHFFYGTNKFRVFPTCPGRPFKTKRPLLARLSPRQRDSLTSLELRLGPGWNKPPRGWVVNEALALRKCFNVRTLTVFVECDPSDGIFNGFRRADGYYEDFCRDLLDQVLAEMPWLTSVEFDAWPSVKKSGAMMQGLLGVAAYQNRRVRWGPERGWTDAPEDDVGTALPSARSVKSMAGLGMPGILVVA